jgi:hypothetical protein
MADDASVAGEGAPPLGEEKEGSPTGEGAAVDSSPPVELIAKRTLKSGLLNLSGQFLQPIKSMSIMKRLNRAVASLGVGGTVVDPSASIGTGFDVVPIFTSLFTVLQVRSVFNMRPGETGKMNMAAPPREEIIRVDNFVFKATLDNTRTELSRIEQIVVKTIVSLAESPEKKDRPFAVLVWWPFYRLVSSIKEVMADIQRLVIEQNVLGSSMLVKTIEARVGEGVDGVTLVDAMKDDTRFLGKKKEIIDTLISKEALSKQKETANTLDAIVPRWRDEDADLLYVREKTNAVFECLDALTNVFSFVQHAVDEWSAVEEDRIGIMNLLDSYSSSFLVPQTIRTSFNLTSLSTRVLNQLGIFLQLKRILFSALQKVLCVERLNKSMRISVSQSLRTHGMNRVGMERVVLGHFTRSIQSLPMDLKDRGLVSLYPQLVQIPDIQVICGLALDTDAIQTVVGDRSHFYKWTKRVVDGSTAWLSKEDLEVLQQTLNNICVNIARILSDPKQKGDTLYIVDYDKEVNVFNILKVEETQWLRERSSQFFHRAKELVQEMPPPRPPPARSPSTTTATAKVEAATPDSTPALSFFSADVDDENELQKLEATEKRKELETLKEQFHGAKTKEEKTKIIEGVGRDTIRALTSLEVSDSDSDLWNFQRYLYNKSEQVFK